MCRGDFALNCIGKKKIVVDSATSVVVIIGFRIAKKPSDKEHPLGNSRMELVAALIVLVLLFIVGMEFLEKSIRSMFLPQTYTTSANEILLISGIMIIKELMLCFSGLLGDIIDSQTLKADALHHRSDDIATGIEAMR